MPAALPADLSERLRRLARAESVTPFMLLLAAFQALLARWSGQDEVVVGVPVANRERAEIEGLVGFFVNTLVLPTSCAGIPPGASCSAGVREVALGAFAHQAMPFEVLVEELAPERDGLQPLFQVMFQLQTVPVPRFTLPGAAVEVLDLDLGASPFDLVLDLRETPETPETPEGMAGVLQASADLFDPGHPRPPPRPLPGPAGGAGRRSRAARGRAAAAEPGRAPPDRDRVERHERPYERDRCIHELVAEQVARTPDAEALSFADGRLTYAELEARSNRAGPASPAARRRPGREGGSPHGELRRLLRRPAGDPQDRRRLPAARPHLARFPGGPPAGGGGRGPAAHRRGPEGGRDLPPVPGPAASAGVPGEPGLRDLHLRLHRAPQGVAVPHRAVVRMVRSAEAVPIAADDRVAQVSNVSFDGLVYEIWGR